MKHSDTIEAVAEAIYGDFEFLGPPGKTKPAWQPGGNSVMQDKARLYAISAVKVIRDRMSRDLEPTT